jgi:hypothetical protein
MDELKAFLGIAIFLLLLIGFIYGLCVSAEKPKHLSE